MIYHRILKCLSFLLLALFLPGFALAASSVRIISDAFEGKVEVGETFHITIEARDAAGHLDVSQLPPGVKVVYKSTQQSSRMSTVNGKTQQEFTTSLILTCKGVSPGKYSFGPVAVDGRKSNTVTYQVVEASPESKSRRASSSPSSPYDPSSGPLFIGKGNEEMYLRASVNKTSAYEQEAVEYTVKLYTTYGDIKFLGAAAAPKFDGFVVEESSDVSSSFSFEDIGGKTFKTAVIARYIIFPQKAGRLRVQGNTYTVSTDARQYYHDPYYQTITVKQPVQLNVTPNEVVIDVKDLPSPVPADFIGAVGSFSISSSMPVTSLSTNSAASLVYTVSGTGNVKYVKLPELQSFFPPSFEVYSPSVSVDADVVGGTVKGSARFEYSVIPREAGRFTVPALSFSYFDPSEGVYKPLRTSPFDVSVAMGQSSSKSQQAMSFDDTLLPVGSTSLVVGRPYVYGFLYWLWYIVPVVVFLGALVVYRKYLRDHEDMQLFRSRNANRMALRRLAKAAQCIKSHQEEKFYDEMLAALWGYLADKLRIPTSELNRGNVGAEFKAHGVKESTFMPVINLIDECEYAKYTPVSRDANMRQLYADAVESISRVEAEYEASRKSAAKDSGSDDDNDGDGGLSQFSDNSSDPFVS